MTTRPPLTIVVLAIAVATSAQVVRVADTVEATAGVASEVRRSPAGAMVAAWSDPLTGDVNIAHSGDLGQSWMARTSPGVGWWVQLAVQDPDLLDVFLYDVSGPAHRRSTDGGLSWGAVHGLPAALGWPQGLATSSSGVVSAAVVASTSPRDFRIFSSTDGGLTWPIETQVASATATPSVALSGGPGDEFLACWVASLGSDLFLRCARSTDGGATFAPAVDLTNALPGYGQMELARSGARVALAIGAGAHLAASLSTDFGASWSPLVTIDSRASPSTSPWTFSSPSVSMGSTGEIWVAASLVQVRRSPKESAVWRSTDAITWTQIATLPPGLSPCIGLPQRPQVVAGGVDEAWYRSATPTPSASASVGWRTTDGGASWAPPIAFAPTDNPGQPTQGVRVVRLTGGRLVASWLEGTAPLRLLASTSDDDGVTWSPASLVNDAPVSVAVGLGKARENEGVEHRFPRFDVVARPGGGLLIAWLAQDASPCARIRVSRSTDGSSFSPSADAGTLDGFPLSIAEDGAGMLALAWPESGNVMSSRSSDGGASWSTPATVRAATPGFTLMATEIVTTADGKLGLATILDNDTTDASSLQFFLSSDGGATWPGFPSWTPGGRWTTWQPVLASAGPRLVLVLPILHFSGCCDGFEYAATYQSSNNGQSWNEVNLDWFGGLVPPAPLMIGDSLGTIYGTWPYGYAFRHTMGANRREIFAWIPNGNLNDYIDVSLLETNGQISALFADWWGRSPAGVFYTQIPCHCRLTSGPPAQVTSCDLAPVTLSVTAAPNPTYQWYDANGPIPGATSPDLTLADPLIDQPYRVRVENECGGSWSSDSFVTIAEPPSVVDAPRATTVCEGSPISLSATATDATSYQWLRNGVPIPGATAASYARSTAAASDDGEYTVEVTGPCGAVTSPPAVVAVDTPLGAIDAKLYFARDGADLRIQWSEVGVARSYEVRESATAAGGFTTVVATALRGSPGVSVPLPGASAFYRIAGVNACGTGAP